MKQEYKVKDLVYVLILDATIILPGIVERVLREETSEGVSVSYKVKVGPPNKNKIMEIDTEKQDSGLEVYGSLEEMNAVLNERLSQFVNQKCGEAAVRCQEWYGQLIGTAQTTEKQNDLQQLVSEFGPEINQNMKIPKQQAKEELQKRILEDLNNE